MANFILSYDLNGPTPTHTQIDEHLRKLQGAHARVLETVWYVGCWMTEMQLLGYVRSILSPNDQVLVVRAREAAWYDLLVTSDSLKAAWERYREP